MCVYRTHKAFIPVLLGMVSTTAICWCGRDSNPPPPGGKVNQRGGDLVTTWVCVRAGICLQTQPPLYLMATDQLAPRFKF